MILLLLVSVSKMLSNSGTHSKLAVRLKSFLKTLTCNKTWHVVFKSMLTGWLIQVYWRPKRKLGARKDSHPLDIFNNKKSSLFKLCVENNLEVSA